MTGGSEHADVHAIPGEGLECEEAFEGADTTTGYDDMWGHSYTLARAPRAYIGGRPHGR